MLLRNPNICSGTRTIFLIQQLRRKNMGVRWLIKNQQLRNKKLKGQIKAEQ
jgi:hypothetical protein